MPSRDYKSILRCYVTDRKSGDVIGAVRHAVDSGVDMIQIRENDLTGVALLELLSEVVDLTSQSATRILVNDRLDVAIAAGVCGVHLPVAGLPIAKVITLVKLLGVSTHTLEEAITAENEGADFIVFGPIFQTPGKTSIGTGPLTTVCSALTIPVLAIGGIDKTNIPLVMEAGAAGIAAIRMFQEQT